MAELIFNQSVETAPAGENRIPDGISLPIEHTALYELFNVTDKSSKVEGYLKMIWDYAKEVSLNKDRDSLIYEVIRLKNKLGSPSLGENQYARIVNYVKTHNQLKDLNKRMAELNGLST